MNIKEAYSIAHNNIKGRKKIGRVMTVMFFIALFVYFLINSMAHSIDNLVALMKDMPVGRTITFSKDENLPSDFIEVCEGIENVTEVYPYIFQVEVNVDGMKDDNKKTIDVKAYSSAYEDFIVEGEVPKKGEVLIPHYMDMATGGQYDDGAKYIGRNIKIYVTNYNGDEKEYTYKISGTYNNIYAMTGFETMFVQPDEAVCMKEYSYEGIENELEKIMEINGDYNPEHYQGFEMVYEYAVVVDGYENVSKVKAELSDKLGVSCGVEVDMSRNELQGVFDVIQFIGAILTMILLIAVVIMMLVMIGNDIRERKKEMAVYLVQGYTRKHLVQILGMEYALRMSPVLLFAAVVTVAVLVLENLAIRFLLAPEYQILHMSFGIGSFITGVVVLLIVVAVAVFNISEKVRKIDLLEEIKSEG